MVKVHNLNNTGNRNPPPGYSSWKQWWERKTGRSFSKCSRYGCNSLAEVGAHVQKDSMSDRSWYIVPLCKLCNGMSSNASFYVEEKDLVAIR